MLKRSISVFIQRSKDFIGLRSVCLFMPANDYKMDTCICAPMNGKGSVYSLCWLRTSDDRQYIERAVLASVWNVQQPRAEEFAGARRVCWGPKSLLGPEEFPGAQSRVWLEEFPGARKGNILIMDKEPFVKQLLFYSVHTRYSFI